MEHYVKMTISEYNDLVTKQNEPSTILQNTVDNYKQKLSDAQSEIKELNASLSMYIIGGARVRVKEPIEDSTRTRHGSFDEIGLDEEAIVQKISEMPKMVTRARWSAINIAQLKNFADEGYTLVQVMLHFDMERTEAAIRSKLNQLHIFVVKGKLVKGDRYGK